MRDEFPAALLEGFREEARELLADMESALLELESAPADGEQVARAFRALHTIKGNAAIFGFAEIEGFAHAIENVFDLLRKGRMAITREIIALTLEAKDRLLSLLAAGEDCDAERRGRAQLRERVALLLGQASRAPGAPATPAPSEHPAQPAEGRWRIGIRPRRTLLAQGTDPLAALEDLRALGTCRVSACFDQVPPLEAMDPEACYVTWEVDLATARGEAAIRDALLFLGGAEEIRVVPAEAERGPAPAPAPSNAARQSAAARTVRVGTDKLDALVNLVGELVTVQARLTRVADRSGDAELLGVAEEVGRISAELRDRTLNVRMVPIGSAFAKLRRHVRDLAHEIGREVELVTDGEATELDKSVIDRLSDPVLHLLRNGIDHGIEPPEERERAGKPRRGTVRLSASHEGGSVLLRVEDDGAGIDLEAVRRRAVERGLLAEHESRTERELCALLFLPGFSTSRAVSTISGRGVGLDVVQRAVEALRGSVRVETRRGAGTTFEIRLPLTLAIIEGLDVLVGPEHFILPLAAVHECVELVRGEGARPGSGGLARIRGEQVPYVRLRDWFGVPGEAPAREQIVVTEADGWRVGLAVDAVVGEQQAVIKPLGRLFSAMRGLAGATVLGDGTVALILDVGQLVRQVERGATAPAAAAGAQC